MGEPPYFNITMREQLSEPFTFGTTWYMVKVLPMVLGLISGAYGLREVCRGGHEAEVGGVHHIALVAVVMTMCFSAACLGTCLGNIAAGVYVGGEVACLVQGWYFTFWGAWTLLLQLGVGYASREILNRRIFDKQKG